MKEVNLTITVKYTIHQTYNMPFDVYDDLCLLAGQQTFGFKPSEEYAEATDWLADHMKECDAHEWEYEILDIEEVFDEE